MTEDDMDELARNALDRLTRAAHRRVQKRIDKLKRQLLCARATIADLRKELES